MIRSRLLQGNVHPSSARLAATVALVAVVVCCRVVPSAAQQAPAQEVEKILLTAGRSTVLTTLFDITRIADTNPEVADAVVVQPREVLIDGKSAGTVSLILWGAGGQRTAYDVVVDPGVPPLQQAFQNLFPGEDIRVSVNEDAIILSGRVSNNDVKLRAGEIAATTAVFRQKTNRGSKRLPGFRCAGCRAGAKAGTHGRRIAAKCGRMGGTGISSQGIGLVQERRENFGRQRLRYDGLTARR